MSLEALFRKLISSYFPNSSTAAKRQQNASSPSDPSSTKEQSNSDFDNVPAPLQAPSRYQDAWTEAKELIDDESELAQYHPSRLSAGDWKEATEELEKLIERQKRSENQTTDSQSENLRNPTKTVQDKSIINKRLSEVIQNTGDEDDPLNYEEDSNTDEWLDVWARWRALSSPPDVEPESQSVTVLKGVGESVAAPLKRAGYATLSDISGASEDDLRQVEGIGKKRAQSILRQVVYRPVEEIPGVGEKTKDRLHGIEVATAADLTALSVEDLIDVEGIGSDRAKTLQARAAVWLPSFIEPPDPLCNSFQPPYDSPEEANKQLDEFERMLRTVGNPGDIIRTLADSPLETPEQEALAEQLFGKEGILAGADRPEATTEPTWMDVLAELESLAEEFEQPSLHRSVRERLDIEALPTVEAGVANIFDEEAPSTAIERIDTTKETLAEQARVAELADTGSSVVAVAQASSVDGTDALAETLTVQLKQAYEQLVGSGKVDRPTLLEEFLDASHQAIDLAESYPDYPFEKVVADLATIDDLTATNEDRLTTLSEILSVSNDALAMLDTIEYDHPAVDQANWQESIRDALKNRYAKILNPIDQQLSRLEGGLWEPQDLSSHDWQEFEYLIGDLYRDEGYEVTVSQSGPDMGVDVWARDNGTRTAIQVKHFQAGNTVGREPLQKLVSTLAKDDADQAVVATSSVFAETAERYAADFGADLRLVGREELLRRLSESTIPP